MNKHEMIEALIDDDVERFFNNDNPADLYAYHRRYGFNGYENWHEDDLRAELIDRQIIEGV